MRINCAKSLIFYPVLFFCSSQVQLPCMHTQLYLRWGANPINCLILTGSHAGNSIKELTACITKGKEGIGIRMNIY